MCWSSIPGSLEQAIRWKWRQTISTRLFRINIHAPYHAAVAAARHMPDGGRIIFIGSTNADRTPMSGLAAYGASKAGSKGNGQRIGA
ncbi:hypothetical protein GCM10023158_23740 [Gluconacetobacter tumulicola]